jgi:hypothetical protein
MITTLQKQTAALKAENTIQTEKQQLIISQLLQQTLLLEKRLAVLESKQ